MIASLRKFMVLSFLSFSLAFTSMQNLMAMEDDFNVPKEIKEMSVQKLKKVALPKENGDPVAQFWLGELSSSSHTKPKKLETQDWWKAAALLGHKGAVRRLIDSQKPAALTLRQPEETKKFHEKYRALYDAAEVGDPAALLKIGDLYNQSHFEDIGMQHNKAKAIKYWGLAAIKGHSEGIEKIYKMNFAFINGQKVIA